MIIQSGINIIYKTLSYKEPVSMIELNKTNINARTVSKWYTRYNPKSKTIKSFYIYKALQNYYTLPHEIEMSKSSTFGEKLKKYLQNTPVDIFDTND